MIASEYQRLANRTLLPAPEMKLTDAEVMKLWNAIGLAGEAGELCELIKKGILHRHGIDLDKIKKEAGDICWYLAGLLTQLGLSFDEVLSGNIEKLKQRYPDGFTSADSKKRADENA